MNALHALLAADCAATFAAAACALAAALNAIDVVPI
jgi:hypothetical protein